VPGGFGPHSTPARCPQLLKLYSANGPSGVFSQHTVFGTARGPVEGSFKTMQPPATVVFEALNIRRESNSVEKTISRIVSTLISGSSIQSRRGSFASVEVS
jgi:hypothetical protein